MPDVREITVEVEKRYKVDVEGWFTEFEKEWLEFLEGDEPTDEDREEFIRESMHILAAEDSLHLGAINWEDEIMNVEMSRASNTGQSQESSQP